MLVVFVVEQLFMISEPGLKFGGAPHVLLHLLRPVHLGLLHLRQVHHVGRQALALERAPVGLQLPLAAVAVGQLRLRLEGDGRLSVGQDFPVVGGDDLLHVGAGGVGYLQARPVEGLAQGSILGEALVDEGEEPCSNVGFSEPGLNLIECGGLET